MDVEILAPVVYITSWRHGRNVEYVSYIVKHCHPGYGMPLVARRQRYWNGAQSPDSGQALGQKWRCILGQWGILNHLLWEDVEAEVSIGPGVGGEV